MQNTELVDFTGGINTVVAPHLIPFNEARALTNVDIEFGSLKSVTELEHITSALGAYFVEYKRKLYWYDTYRTNALIDDKLYWADGAVTGKILPDGRELSLGLPTPNGRLTQSPDGAVGNGAHKGDFKYTYTFYSSDTGTESAPAPLPGYITLDEENTSLSGFDVLPTDADSYRIYRIGGYLARFTLVDTVTTVPYIDSLDDTLIDGRLLQTLRSGPPPASIQNFVELNGRLYGSVGNKVYYSGLGNPDSWYTDDFFNLPDYIVGLAKTPAGLLILGPSYTYLLFGAGPTSFRTKVVSDYLGCRTNKSIAYYNHRVIWLGEEGILMSDGYSIENLTYRRIESITDTSVSSAIVVNDTYYMSFKPELIPTDSLFPEDNLYPGGTKSNEVGTDSAEGLIVIDFKRGNLYSYYNLAYQDAVSVGIYQNLLYIVSSADKEFLDCTSTLVCDEIFCKGEYSFARLGGSVSSEFKELFYISPQLIDGSYSTLKEYDKIRVNYIGDFVVKVIFSDFYIPIVANIKTPRSILSNLELSKERDSVAIIGIPNKANKSYSIQFSIQGKGIVKSIQYSWKNRELQ